MVALISMEQSKFFNVQDNDRFTTALTVSVNAKNRKKIDNKEKNEDDDEDEEDEFMYPEESFLAISGSNESTTLQLFNFNKNCPRLSAKGNKKKFIKIGSIIK